MDTLRLADFSECGPGTMWVMATKRQTKPASPPWYSGADVPMRAIRGFARRVAERFQPERIILFGSHAYGHPHDDSDVDNADFCLDRDDDDSDENLSVTIEGAKPATSDQCLEKMLDRREQDQAGTATPAKLLSS